MSVVLLFKTRTPNGVFTCEARVPDIYNLITRWTPLVCWWLHRYMVGCWNYVLTTMQAKKACGMALVNVTVYNRTSIRLLSCNLYLWTEIMTWVHRCGTVRQWWKGQVFIRALVRNSVKGKMLPLGNNWSPPAPTLMSRPDSFSFDVRFSITVSPSGFSKD